MRDASFVGDERTGSGSNPSIIQETGFWRRRRSSIEEPVTGSTSERDPSGGSRDRPSRFTLLFAAVVIVAGGIFTVWGGARFFDQFGPSLTEDATITDRDHSTYTCTRGGGNTRRNETCHRYVVEGRTTGGDSWSVKDKHAYDESRRGESIEIERSRVTGRVLKLQGSDWSYNARRAIMVQLLGLMLLALGIRALVMGYSLAKGGPSLAVAVPVGAILFAAGAIPTGLVVINPIDSGTATDSAGVEDVAATSDEPSTTTTETTTTTTATTTTTVPATTEAPATTAPTTTTSTTAPAVPGPGTGAVRLLEIFGAPSVSLEMARVSLSHLGEGGPFDLTFMAPLNWTIEVGDGSRFTVEIVQPEDEFGEYQYFAEDVSMAFWGRQPATVFEEHALQVFLRDLESGDIAELVIDGRRRDWESSTSRAARSATSH